MKKCYFIGTSEIYDTDLVLRLQGECEKIIEAEDQVEFWFFQHEQNQFVASCLCLATHLRTKYPEKVKIVRVFDPTKENTTSDWYKAAYNTHFPRSLADINVFSPLMDEGVAKNENQFIQHFHKMERWILRQMDIIFAYYYSNLEDSVIAQIEHAQRSSNAEVIHISFEETEQFIQEKAETMFDERTTKILAMLRENVPQKDIAKSVGVSTSRIGQISHKAARDIRNEIKRRGVRFKREDNVICGICGLSNNGNAFQLVVFESLVAYLGTAYNVKQFWIDEKSCNTAYGAILAKYCAGTSIYKPSAKVVVCSDMEDLDVWGNTVNEYVPPFNSVVSLGLDSPDQRSIYGDMIRQSHCVIADLTSPEGQFIIDECAASSDIKYLFDIPKSKYGIDRNYEI